MFNCLIQLSVCPAGLMFEILQLEHLHFNAKEGFLETSSWFVLCELSSQLGWTRLDFLTTFDDVWQIPNPTGFMSPRSLRIGASRNAWQAQLQLGAWSYSPRMGWGSFSGTLVYLVKTCTNFGFPAGFSWNVLIELLFISGVEQWVQVDGATIGSARRLQQKRGSRHVSCTWEDGLGGWALAAGFLPQNLDAGALRILKGFTNISPTSMLHQCCIINHHQSSSGWWFQTFFIFHFIYGMSSFPLTFIFFKMVKTTNQSWFFFAISPSQAMVASAAPFGLFCIPDKAGPWPGAMPVHAVTQWDATGLGT